MKQGKQIFISVFLLGILISGIFPYAAFHHHEAGPICELESTKIPLKHKPGTHIHETHPSCNLCDEVILKNANLISDQDHFLIDVFDLEFKPASVAKITEAAISSPGRDPPFILIG